MNQTQNAPMPSERQQALAWIEEVSDRAEDQNNSAHARLILTGIGANQTARRMLFLLASFRAGETTRVPLGKAFALAAMPRKRFNALLDALRACGALLPDPALLANPDEIELLLDAIEKRRMCEANWENRVAVALTEARWRECIGETVNPAVVTLLQSEGEN